MVYKKLLVITVAWTHIICQDQPSCDSLVYCQGSLLHTVQTAAIFNDSKTFVDLKMLNSVDQTLANFDRFMEEHDQNPSKLEVAEFVTNNFRRVNEYEDWVPPDFIDNPVFLDKIAPVEVKEFATDLVNIWPVLARKVIPDVARNPEQYSLIPVTNGFIIPGGRFNEFYYWDSYWIIKGLLLSEMTETVRGMLDNFISMVQRFGFVPNGARVYYLNRSQPPLLTMMASAYVECTNDTDWLKDNIDLLEEELHFWLDKRTVEIEKNNVRHTLAHYDSESGSPRPESYREDVRAAQIFPQQQDKIQLYADLKSGAESGWDFSSRWIVDDDGGTNANISYIKTRRIIPVDLNSFLCKVFRQMSEFFIVLDQHDKAIFWYEKSTLWRKTIDQVLYDEIDGIWYDYDYHLKKSRRLFYPSNFAPLWAEAYHPADGQRLGRRAVQYLTDQSIAEYQGGIPTSLDRSGEQWDFPNAWPPLQALIIFGLENTGEPSAKSLAREFARQWVQANIIGFNETAEMFEKYDAVNPGKYGGGGEYQVQSGFGWTNGVALELINHFYTRTPGK